MVAAVNPSLFDTIKAEQHQLIRAQLELTSDGFKGVKRNRIRLVSRDERKNKQYRRFIDRAYEQYHVATGKVVSAKGVGAGEFVTWLLEWIKNNPETIVRFITLILSLFGL